MSLTEINGLGTAGWLLAGGETSGCGQATLVTLCCPKWAKGVRIFASS